MTDVPAALAGGHLPTPIQKQLLKVIVGPEDQLIENWQRWQRELDLDDVDHGSYRILPMLYHVLRKQGVTGPDLQRYHGVARKTWYTNRLKFHRIEKLLEQMHAEGTEVAVLKGVPISHLYYPDPGLRPMDDVDILVSESKSVTAIDWFLDRGWKSVYELSRKSLTKFLIRKEHSADLRDDDGFSVDLHWQVLTFRMPPAVGQEMWDAMRPVKIGSVMTQTLCATDHLLHICAHGNAWNAVPPLRWIVDAHLILKRDGANIDWKRFVRLTEQLQIAQFISRALDYLHEEFGQPIPLDVLDQLREIPRQKWHEDEYAAWTSSSALDMRDYQVRYRYERFRAVLPEWQKIPAWRARRDYLKLHWELDSDAELIGRIVLRMGQKIWRKLCA